VPDQIHTVVYRIHSRKVFIPRNSGRTQQFQRFPGAWEWHIETVIVDVSGVGLPATTVV